MRAVGFNSFQLFPALEDVERGVAMYRAGQIVPDVERHSPSDALEAYRKLEAGQLTARAVVVPHG